MTDTPCGKPQLKILSITHLVSAADCLLGDAAEAAPLDTEFLAGDLLASPLRRDRDRLRDRLRPKDRERARRRP